MAIGSDPRRGSKRRRISYPATLYNLDRSVLCRCKIRDMSDTGARLTFGKESADAIQRVPQSFLLSLTESEDPINEAFLVFRICEKVWARDDEMGVKFLKNLDQRARKTVA